MEDDSENDTMKIEIEISDVEAACLWTNHHKQPIADIVQCLVRADVHEFKTAFPKALPGILKQWEEENKCH